LRDGAKRLVVRGVVTDVCRWTGGD
jgi:hypothetical protein